MKLNCPGFNESDNNSAGIMFHDKKETDQTSKINTHLVNFRQPSQSGAPSIVMNNIKTESDNIGTYSTTQTDNIKKIKYSYKHI